MIHTLRHEIDAAPAEAQAAIERGQVARGGLPGMLLSVGLPPVRQVVRGVVVAWRCPGCGLASPADMIHRGPDGEWRCSGCVEREYFTGQKTRTEAWSEVGQEDMPMTDYWTRRAAKRG